MRRLNRFAVLAVAVLLLAGACTRQPVPPPTVPLGECDAKPNDCNTGPTKKGGTVVKVISTRVGNWNANSVDGNTLDMTSVLNGVLPNSFVYLPDNTVVTNSELLVSAEVTAKNPQTVVYKIQPDAVWDDGTPISAKDFVYAWHTLNGRDCPACDAATTTGYDRIESVAGSADGKTVTTVYNSPFPDWRSLFNGLYPAHVAAKYGNDDSAAGLKKAWDGFKTNQINFSGWAYQVSAYQKDISITLTPNEKFYGKTKPRLERVVFRIITDPAQQISSLRAKDVNLVQVQPSAAIVDQVRKMDGVAFTVTPGASFEHIEVNTKNPFLADPVLRRAIFTAVNTKEIISKTLPFFAKAAPLANHMLLPGQPGYRDNIGDLRYGSGDAAGAIKLLADAGYVIDQAAGLKTKGGQVVPPINFVYTEGNEARQQTAELLQSQLRPLGLTVKPAPTKDLRASLDNHVFDVAIFAFVGAPFPTRNVDLWRSNGGGNYAQLEDAKIDTLMRQVSVELDQTRAADLLNQADRLVFEDAADLTLFQKPEFIAVSHDYVAIRPNGTTMTSTYNIEEWALRR